MAVVRRSGGPRGPRFYQDGDALMFVNVIDGMTQDGPRVATDDDQAGHPDALAIYRGEKPDPMASFAPIVKFADPPGGAPEKEPLKARGEKAPA